MNQEQEIIPINQDYLHNARQVFENLDVQESTRKDYQYRIGLFADFVASKGMNHNTLLEFKRHLASRNDLAVSSKNKFFISAKILLRELYRLGRIPIDITQNIKTFKQNHQHKREGLNEEEMQRLANWLQTLPVSPVNIRLKAFISLLALQGLREIEVVRLDVHDLDLVGNTAAVRGKGQSDTERVHLHPETSRTLREHLKVNKVGSGPVFTSRSNNSKNNRLTTRGLRKIVTDVLQDLGIDKVPHGFRHFFCTQLITAYKGDVMEVARYTRHKTLQVVMQYNDNVKRKADLPRYYETFRGLIF